MEQEKPKLTIKEKFGIGLAELIIKRLMSNSSAFGKAIRVLCMKWVVIDGLLLGVISLLPIRQDVKDMAEKVIGLIGVVILGVGGGTHLTTNDPALMSPDAKSNVIELAAPIGPTPDGGTLN